MKKTISLLMLILIPSALALYGGESWTYHFDKCDKLRVNITGNLTIDDSEYIIHNDCFNESRDYWICDCHNDFDFNISFKTNTVNNYNLSFNYDYSKSIVEEKSSGSGGGGGSGGWFRRTPIPEEKEEIEIIVPKKKEEKVITEEKVTIVEEEPLAEDNVTLQEDDSSEPKKFEWVLLLIPIIIIIAIVVIYILVKSREN